MIAFYDSKTYSVYGLELQIAAIYRYYFPIKYEVAYLAFIYSTEHSVTMNNVQLTTAISRGYKICDYHCTRFTNMWNCAAVRPPHIEKYLSRPLEKKRHLTAACRYK